MKIQSITVDQKLISSRRLLNALSDDSFVPSKKEEIWHSLINQLPSSLKVFLRSEIELGNFISSLQYANWPHAGSIVVSLGSPFKSNLSNNFLHLKHRVLNDPHYWKEDVSETNNGIDHLIIC